MEKKRKEEKEETKSSICRYIRVDGSILRNNAMRYRDLYNDFAQFKRSPSHNSDSVYIIKRRRTRAASLAKKIIRE